ncbi:MAG: DUF2116 family Zn-ribbon domain-containing protein [Promethearchaeota archaeon]|nr:MAG: DUF2116 family Zn-ribbon domain-containing protein [Candidatus Lokiarchaeota archaeon]
MSKFERHQKKGDSYYVYPHKHCKQCGQMIEESLTYCDECYQKLKEKKKKKKDKKLKIKKSNNASENNEES